MRRTEGKLVPVLLKYAEKCYGPEAIFEAWDEFSLWNEVPFDIELQPEIDTAFIPWFLFNWIPDNGEVDKAEYYPEMQIAKHYLENKGRQLDSFERHFISEICSRPYSFFMVTGVEPGEKMTLRDIMLDQEITVHERQGSSSLKNGSVLYARTLTMNDNSIMVGCAPTVIPPTYVNEIIDFREDMKEKYHHYDQQLLLDYDIEARGIYYDIRKVLYNPVLPKLQNTDGDPMRLTKLYYVLECTPLEALDALATLSLAENANELIATGDFDSQGNLTSIEFPWLKKGNKQHKDWNNTVMGNIVIDKDKLTVDINSADRSEEIKRIVMRRLGKRAVFRNASIQSVEKIMEELANKPAGSGENIDNQENEDLMAMPEVQEKLMEMSKQHWVEWLDTPIPVLRNQTPHDAAKSKTGRERLNALLFDFEQRADSSQPFKPDIPALRKSLGIENLIQ